MGQPESALDELDRVLPDIVQFPTAVPGIVEDYVADCGSDDDAAQRAAERIAESVDASHAGAILVQAELRELGATAAADRLLDRILAQVDVTSADAVAGLLSQASHIKGDPDALTRVIARLRERGAIEAIDLRQTRPVLSLLRSLQRISGDQEAAAALAQLLARDLGAHCAVRDPDTVGAMYRTLRSAGAADSAARLIRRAAAEMDVTDPQETAKLLTELHQNETEPATLARLARRIGRETTPGDATSAFTMLWALYWATVPAGTPRGVPLPEPLAEFARRTAAQAEISPLNSALRLMRTLSTNAWEPQAYSRFASRLAEETDVSNAHACVAVFKELRTCQRDEAARTLARRVAQREAPQHPVDIHILSEMLREIGMNAEADDMRRARER